MDHLLLPPPPLPPPKRLLQLTQSPLHPGARPQRRTAFDYPSKRFETNALRKQSRDFCTPPYSARYSTPLARVSFFPYQLQITPFRLTFVPGIADFKLSGVPPQPPKLPHPADALDIFRALFLDVLALHSRPLADVHAQELAGLLFQRL
jgi:hypothetical protein